MESTPAARRSGGGHALAAGLLAALVVLAGCSPAPTPTPSGPATAAPATAEPTTPVSTAQATPSRAEGWRSDLAALVPAMAAIHPDLFHGTSRAELDAAVAALSATVDTATDDELLVGLLRIVALVSRDGCDAQTGAYIWETWGSRSRYHASSLPLRLWLFDDEVVIVGALPQQASLIGSRIDAIEGHPIAEVLAAIDPLVPRDNGQTVRMLTPRFLLTPEVLRGLHLAGDGPVSLSLSAMDGTASTVEIEPIGMREYNDWVGGSSGLLLPADPTVRYLSRIDELLWWELLSDGETLFVQLNRIESLELVQLSALDAALRTPDVARVVLDLRHNEGGVPDPGLDALTSAFERSAVAGPNRLYVLMGRNTFSAASLLVARLDRNTDAVLVGEAMGGCPTFYSLGDPVELPWSHIEVRVATDVAVGVDPADPRLTIEPDVRAVLTREEWADGDDPALGLFIGIGP